MLYLWHESIKFGTQRGYQRGDADHGEANPGSMDRNKNCGSIAGFGGSAAGIGNRFVWTKPYDSGALDLQSEPGRATSPRTKASSRPPNSANAGSEAKVGAASGKESAGIRLAQGYLGWANTGSTLKRELWSEAESASSPEVVASIRLQPKACRLCLSSSPCRRFPQFSKGV